MRCDRDLKLDKAAMISKKNEREQLDALERLIAENPNGASFEMIEDGSELGISTRTLQRRLATLVEQGRIEPVGQTRALKYRTQAAGTSSATAFAHESESGGASPEQEGPQGARPELGSDAPHPLPAIFASPELTGGAGFTFEDAVVATYHSALIAQTSSALGMPGRMLWRVAQQQASNGEPLDDLIIDGRGIDNSIARLRLQVKRALVISDAPSNADFRDIVLKSLATIQKPEFRLDIDRVGAAVGSIADVNKRALETLCEVARHANDPIAFMSQFRARGGAGPAQRRIVRTLRNILSSAGIAGADAAIFQLLKHFVLIQFDVLHEGASGPALAIAQLSSCLAAVDVPRAPDLWDRLCRIAREGAGRKAALSRAALLSMLHGGFRFAGSANLRPDLDKLHVEASLALGEITTEIDGIHLKRPRPLAEIDSQVSNYRFTQIVGLAGSGKSVILEQFTQARRAPVLFIKSDRIHSGTWPHHAAALGLASRDPTELLAEIGACGTPILFIDGLDRIEVQHRGAVTDLINAILTEPSLAHWKVLATMRNNGIEPLRDWLPAKLLAEGAVATVEVGTLDDDEARELARERPALAPVLFGPKPLEEIARRPFFLAVLAREVARSGHKKNLPTSEVDLMGAWWRRGGYSGENAHLIKRQNTLLELASAGAADFGRRMPIGSFDAEALASLRSDGIIRDVRPGHTVAFAHDIFFEWAFTQALIRLDDRWIDGLRQAGEPPVLSRVVELLSQDALHQNGRWEAELIRLEGTDIRPQWRRAWLLGPFSSPRFHLVEKQISPIMLKADAPRLRQLIVWFQAEKTRPNPLVLSGQLGSSLGSREQTLRMADMFAWPSDVFTWRRLLDWVFSHLASMPVKLRPDIVSLFEVWQNVFSDISNAYSNRILGIASQWLEDLEGRRHSHKFSFDRGPWHELRDRELEDIEHRLRVLLLRAARGNRASVTNYLERLHLSDRARHAAFESIVAFAPTLATTHPKEYAELVADELLKELPDDQAKRAAEEERRSPMYLGSRGIGEYEWRRLAIEEHATLFSPASSLSEPFHSMLRAAPEHGLGLVRRLCNHAMLAWRQLHAMEPERFGTPVPIELNFPWGRAQFWGDRNVYRWFRGILGPGAVESALMTLEHWAFAEIDRGRPPDEVIEQVVAGNDCCAVLGIASALALSKLHVSPATLPLITCQHLWHWDLQRMIEDKSGLHPNMIGGGLLRRDRRHIEATDQSNKRPARGYYIRHLVTPAVLSSNEEIAKAAQATIRSFPQKLPFSLAEEQQDSAHVQDLARTAEIWSETGRPETYVAQPTDDGRGTLIFHQSPKAADADVKAAAARAAEMNADIVLLNWAQSSFDNAHLDDSLSLARAIEQAKSLDRSELFGASRQPGHADLFRTAAVAGAAAAILSFAPDLTGEQLAWATDIVRRASLTPAPEDEYGAEFSANPRHPCRYAARGLSALIQREPGNIAPKEMLLHLIGHLVYDVSEEALKAALGCWSVDANFVWLSLDLGLRLAISPAAHYGHGAESCAARHKHRVTAVETARSMLVSGIQHTQLVALPPAWVYAPAPARDDPFHDRHKPKGPIWRDPDERWNWHFAPRVLRHIPIAQVLGDPSRRDQFLLLCESLIKWTIERIAPPWAQEGKRRRERSSTDLIEWNGHFFQWLAQLAAHLPRDDVRARILKPIFSLDDDDFLTLITPFCSLYVCIAVYDASRISSDAIEILSDCRDRFLKCDVWESARLRHGDLYGPEAPELLKDFLFDFDRPAMGSTRFANDDLTDVALIIPCIDPIVRSVGDVPHATMSFLNLCERAKGTYPTAIFMEQMLAVLGRSDGMPVGWHTTNFPGRIANLIQFFAERDHPLATSIQQQMLRVLDRLVDMGDRRAAALQSSELFKNTRVDH
jgi:hypothetical protein